jgi:hypothetical protein
MKGPLARIVQPRLRRPFVRITLDEIGAFVWERCDGSKTVGEIVEEMEAHFADEQTGEPMENAVERMQLFLQQLVTGGMVDLMYPGSEGST